MISLGGTFSIPLARGDEFDASSRKNSSLRRTDAAPLRDYIGDEDNGLLRSLFTSLKGTALSFTPLVIHGPPSAGKTSLALALAEQSKQQAPRGKVVALTAADFARSYADAVDTDALPELRQRFLKAGLVIVDDVQHLAGKAAAQAELRTLLDLMRKDEVLVIVTSNAPPAALPFAADLRSRLAEGLVVPLRWPGEAARREMVARYLAARQVELSDQSIARLAAAYLGSPARLFAGLAHLVHAARTDHRQLDDALVHEALASLEGTNLSPRAVIAAVAKQFGVTVKDLKGSSRRQAINVARGVAMYLLRTHVHLTYEQIGQHFAGRDHTTVMNACQKTTERLAADPHLAHEVEQIVTHLHEAA